MKNFIQQVISNTFLKMGNLLFDLTGLKKSYEIIRKLLDHRRLVSSNVVARDPLYPLQTISNWLSHYVRGMAALCIFPGVLSCMFFNLFLGFYSSLGCGLTISFISLRRYNPWIERTLDKVLLETILETQHYAVRETLLSAISRGEIDNINKILTTHQKADRCFNPFPYALCNNALVQYMPSLSEFETAAYKSQAFSNKSIYDGIHSIFDFFQTEGKRKNADVKFDTSIKKFTKAFDVPEIEEIVLFYYQTVPHGLERFRAKEIDNLLHRYPKIEIS